MHEFGKGVGERRFADATLTEHDGVLTALREGAATPTDDGEVRFVGTERFREMELAPDAAIRRLSAEQSNSSMIIGEAVVLKILRKLARRPADLQTKSRSGREYASAREG